MSESDSNNGGCVFLLIGVILGLLVVCCDKLNDVNERLERIEQTLQEQKR